jgi:hypothetical protein
LAQVRLCRGGIACQTISGWRGVLVNDVAKRCHGVRKAGSGRWNEGEDVVHREFEVLCQSSLDRELIGCLCWCPRGEIANCRTHDFPLLDEQNFRIANQPDRCSIHKQKIAKEDAADDVTEL